jgi:antitoxin component of MazEF toxin-antitoxin module
MDLKPGDKITFSLLSDGTLVVRPKVRSVADLIGLLHQPGVPAVPASNMKVVLDSGKGQA